MTTSPVPTITVSTPSLVFGSVTVGSNSSFENFTVSGSNLAANIAIAAPPGFEISTSSGSGYGISASLTQSGGTVNSTTIYARFSPLAAQSYSGNITFVSSGATSKNVSVSGTGTSAVTPTITVSASSLTFEDVAVGANSVAQGYTVSGSDLTANITITAPVGFQISKTIGSGYTTSSLTLTQSGGIVNSTNIYARFSPTAAQSYSGNITHISSGATSRSVAVTGNAGSTCSHNWALVTYTSSMTLYGIVTINGIPATAQDKVGAFVGAECRGIGDITLNQGLAYTTMNIQGIVPESVTFRIWDASECLALPASPPITSNPGGTMGYPNFVQITTSVNVTQTISLSSNWSLFSLYVKSAGRSPADVFGNAACGKIEVKSMTLSYNSTVPEYLNNMKTLTDGQGYFVKSTNVCDISIQDQLIGNNYSVDLLSGWNLVGFPQQSPSGLPGAAQSLISTGKLKQIKNIAKTFNPALEDFMNTLKCVYPGDGYFMNLSGSYSGFTWQQSTCLGEPKSGNAEELCWNVTGYLQSMVVYGDVTLDGASLNGPGTIGAFVGEECRGVASVVFNGGKTYATLVVNGELPETAEFRLCYNNQVLESASPLKTNPGESTTEIVPIRFTSADIAGRMQVMPNPFKTELTIELMTTTRDPAQISVYTVEGKLVKVLTLTGEPGLRRTRWDGNDSNGLPGEQGLYIIQANLVDGVIIKRAMLVR
jgi:hypothetical protein